MKKMRINEIFYSIQGEGRFTGHAAVFVRFAGCNLKCPFCDTDFNDYTELTEDEIVENVKRYGCKLCVMTGGEPTLQLTASLVDKLHKENIFVAVETNGTRDVPENVDWITCSPKEAFVGNVGKPIIKKANELKLVFDGKHDVKDYGIDSENYYLQPCDTGFVKPNEEIKKELVKYVLNHNKWIISLQTQKVLNVR